MSCHLVLINTFLFAICTDQLETIKLCQLNFDHSVLKLIHVPSTLLIFSTLDTAVEFLIVPVQAV